MTSKVYNLKKAQDFQSPTGFDSQMAGEQMQEQGDFLDTQDQALQELDQPQQQNDVSIFNDGAELRDWLTQRDLIDARNSLLGYVESADAQQMVDDLLDNFYNAALSENEKLTISSNLFNLLPAELKGGQEDGIMSAPFTEGSLKDSEEAIRKLAKKYAQTHKTASNGFNLKKFAQQKGFDNTLMYGPDQTYVDPFLMQPASRYSLLERQKGWGMNIGEIYDIDWETMWRGNIMDKYSRPYRDKDGKWVGGYINKRFEVDYNIPNTNDYQLKPGQLRKPILPEYGNTESRMEVARGKGDIPGSPQGKSSVYNWKTANSKKKR